MGNLSLSRVGEGALDPEARYLLCLYSVRGCGQNRCREWFSSLLAGMFIAVGYDLGVGIPRGFLSNDLGYLKERGCTLLVWAIFLFVLLLLILLLLLLQRSNRHQCIHLYTRYSSPAIQSRNRFSTLTTRADCTIFFVSKYSVISYDQHVLSARC